MFRNGPRDRATRAADAKREGLREGMVRKGGHNPQESQIKDRPMPPGSMHAARQGGYVPHDDGDGKPKGPPPNQGSGVRDRSRDVFDNLAKYGTARFMDPTDGSFLIKDPGQAARAQALDIAARFYKDNALTQIKPGELIIALAKEFETYIINGKP